MQVSSDLKIEQEVVGEEEEEEEEELRFPDEQVCIFFYHLIKCLLW